MSFDCGEVPITAFLFRHRRRHVYCAGKDVPVLTGLYASLGIMRLYTCLGITGLYTSLGITGLYTSLGITGLYVSLGIAGLYTSLGITRRLYTSVDMCGDSFSELKDPSSRQYSWNSRSRNTCSGFSRAHAPVSPSRARTNIGAPKIRTVSRRVFFKRYTSTRGNRR